MSKFCVKEALKKSVEYAGWGGQFHSGMASGKKSDL